MGYSSASDLPAIPGHSNSSNTGVQGYSGFNVPSSKVNVGVYGAANESAAGSGIYGEATKGYGGTFKGGKAQFKLIPGASAGKPTKGAHTKGEIYMDSAAALFVCTVSGAPGTWQKLTTTTA
jgi:hypothetical protein